MGKTCGRHLCKFVMVIPKNDFIKPDWQVETADCNLDLSTKVKPKLRMKRTVKAWGPSGQTIEFEAVSHVSLALRRDLDSSLTSLPGSFNFGKPTVIVCAN